MISEEAEVPLMPDTLLGDGSPRQKLQRRSQLINHGMIRGNARYTAVLSAHSKRKAGE